MDVVRSRQADGLINGLMALCGRWPRAVVGALALTLAGCASAPPPPPVAVAPPPPPVAVAPPPMPVPPPGASGGLIVPQLAEDGQRESVNRQITSAQQVWNLRSAFTVAALDCRDPRHGAILPRYRDFLTRNREPLATAYQTMSDEFTRRYHARAGVMREAYLTSVYNHFALPPTLDDFCEAMLGLGLDAESVPPNGLADFAKTALPKVEIVFDSFFDRYDRYRADLAMWRARYGERTAAAMGL